MEKWIQINYPNICNNQRIIEDILKFDYEDNYLEIFENFQPRQETELFDSNLVFKNQVDSWILSVQNAWQARSEGHPQNPCMEHQEGRTSVQILTNYMIFDINAWKELQKTALHLPQEYYKLEEREFNKICNSLPLLVLMKVLDNCDQVEVNENVSSFKHIFINSVFAIQKLLIHENSSVYYDFYRLLMTKYSVCIDEENSFLIFYISFCIFRVSQQSVDAEIVKNIVSKHLRISYESDEIYHVLFCRSLTFLDLILHNLLSFSTKVTRENEWSLMETNRSNDVIVSDYGLSDVLIADIMHFLDITKFFETQLKFIIHKETEDVFVKIKWIHQEVHRRIILIARTLIITKMYKTESILLSQCCKCFNIFSRYVFSLESTDKSDTLSEAVICNFIEEFFKSVTENFSVKIYHKLWSFIEFTEQNTKYLTEICINILMNICDHAISQEETVYHFAYAGMAAANIGPLFFPQALNLFFHIIKLPIFLECQELKRSINLMAESYHNILSGLLRKITDEKIPITEFFSKNISQVTLKFQKLSLGDVLIIVEWICYTPVNSSMYELGFQLLVSLTSPHFLNQQNISKNLPILLSLIIIYQLSNSSLTSKMKSLYQDLLHRIRFDEDEYDHDQCILNVIEFEGTDSDLVRIQKFEWFMVERLFYCVQVKAKKEDINKKVFFFNSDSSNSLPRLYCILNLSISSIPSLGCDGDGQALTVILKSVVHFCQFGHYVAAALCMNRIVHRLKESIISFIDPSLETFKKYFLKLNNISVVDAWKIAIQRCYFWKNRDLLIRFWLSLLMEFPHPRNQVFLELIELFSRLYPNNFNVKSLFILLIKKFSSKGPPRGIWSIFKQNNFPYYYNVSTFPSYLHLSYEWLNAEFEYEKECRLIKSISTAIETNPNDPNRIYQNILNHNTNIYPTRIEKLNIFRRMYFIRASRVHPMSIFCMLDIITSSFYSKEVLAFFKNQFNKTNLSSEIAELVSNKIATFKNNSAEMDKTLKTFGNYSLDVIGAYELLLNYLTNGTFPSNFNADWVKKYFSYESFLEYFSSLKSDKLVNYIPTYPYDTEIVTMQYNKINLPSISCSQYYNSFKFASNEYIKIIKWLLKQSSDDMRQMEEYVSIFDQKIRNLVQISQQQTYHLQNIYLHTTQISENLPFIFFPESTASIFDANKSFYRASTEYNPVIHLKYLQSIDFLKKFTLESTKIEIFCELYTFLHILHICRIKCSKKLQMGLQKVAYHLVCSLKDNITYSLLSNLVKLLKYIIISQYHGNNSDFFMWLSTFVISDVFYMEILGDMMYCELHPSSTLHFLNSFILLIKSTTCWNESKTKIIKRISDSHWLTDKIAKYYIQTESIDTVIEYLVALLDIASLSCRNVSSLLLTYYFQSCVKLLQFLLLNKFHRQWEFNHINIHFFRKLLDFSDSEIKTTKIWELLAAVIFCESFMKDLRNYQPHHTTESHISHQDNPSLLVFMNRHFYKFCQSDLLVRYGHIAKYLLEVVINFSLFYSDQLDFDCKSFVDLWKVPSTSVLVMEHRDVIADILVLLIKYHRLLGPPETTRVESYTLSIYTNYSNIFRQSHIESISKSLNWSTLIIDQEMLHKICQIADDEESAKFLTMFLENLKSNNFEGNIKNFPYMILLTFTKLATIWKHSNHNCHKLFHQYVRMTFEPDRNQPINGQQMLLILSIIEKNCDQLSSFSDSQTQNYSPMKLLLEWLRISFGFESKIFNISLKLEGTLIDISLRSVYFCCLINTIIKYFVKNNQNESIRELVKIVFIDISSIVISETILDPESNKFSINYSAGEKSYGLLHINDILNLFQEKAPNDLASNKFISLLAEMIFDGIFPTVFMQNLWEQIISTNSQSVIFGNRFLIRLLSSATHGLLKISQICLASSQLMYDNFRRLVQCWPIEIFSTISGECDSFWKSDEIDIFLVSIYFTRSSQHNLKTTVQSKFKADLLYIFGSFLKYFKEGAFAPNSNYEFIIIYTLKLIRQSIENNQEFVDDEIVTTFIHFQEKTLKYFLTQSLFITALTGQKSKRKLFSERFRISLLISFLAMRSVSPAIYQLLQIPKSVVDDICNVSDYHLSSEPKRIIEDLKRPNQDQGAKEKILQSLDCFIKSLWQEYSPNFLDGFIL